MSDSVEVLGWHFVLGLRVVWAVDEHIGLLIHEGLDLGLDVGDLALDLSVEAHVIDVGLLDLLAIALGLAHELLLVAILKRFPGLVPAVTKLGAHLLDNDGPISGHGLLGVVEDVVSALLMSGNNDILSAKIIGKTTI